MAIWQGSGLQAVDTGLWPRSLSKIRHGQRRFSLWPYCGENGNLVFPFASSGGGGVRAKVRAVSSGNCPFWTCFLTSHFDTGELNRRLLVSIWDYKIIFSQAFSQLGHFSQIVFPRWHGYQYQGFWCLKITPKIE